MPETILASDLGEKEHYSSVIEEHLTKGCSRCGQNKTLTEFHRRGDRNCWHGRVASCKRCASEYAKKHPRNPLVVRATSLKRYYGITLGEFDHMLETQIGRCLICLKHMEKPHVDHCHKTGKIRGLLCQKCNHGLGLFDESPQSLTNAIAYLKERN